MKIRILICLFLLISLRGYSQCISAVTISQSSQAICSGTSVVLTAKPTAGTPPYTYSWSTGETTASISVNKAGNYTVSVSDNTPGCAPVKQTVTVAAGTTPNAPTAKNVTICSGSIATLMATAPGGTYQWYDAVTGGNFLASGDTYTTQPITTPTVFYVQTTIGGCTSDRTPVNVFVTGRPTVVGATVCSGGVATLMASGGDTYAWYTAPNGGTPVSSTSEYTTPPLTTTTTYYVVATINGCTSVRTPVVATVTQPPSPPTALNQTICSGTSANLHADAPAGVFDWYTTPTGGTSLISSPDYTTPALTATTTYYVQTTIGDCASPRTPVKVFVDSQPTPPDAQTYTICYNTSATLTASATPVGTYKWYDAPAGGNLLATNVTYNTPALTTSTSYYVQAVNGSCVSTRTQVIVIVSPILPAPSVSGAIICSGSIATLSATSAGGTYQWFAAVAGGPALANGTTYTTPSLTVSTTYYVQRTYQGCTSPRVPVTVTVLPLPAAPTAANVSVCSGSPAALTANSPTNNYAWYSSPAGGTLLSSGQVYVTPPLTVATTYYVETSDANGCVSTRKAVTVSINPTPTAPTASNTSICFNTTATLTASAPTGTVQWYDMPSGGTLLKTGNTYTTPALTATTTYYLQDVSGTCISSSRTPVTVSIIPGYNPQFQYSSGTYCVTAANPTPVINNPSGGTFSAAPAGLVFVSTTTGEINIAASTAGKYMVTFTSNGACPGTATARVAIVTTTNASFSYAGPYCQSANDPLPNYGGIGTPGTFSASPAGLVFKNTSTGEIDLANSSAGTYTITNTIAASGTCVASSATASVTIDKQVFVNAGPNQTVPAGTPVQLAGSITGGGTTGTWSGGTGSFSNPTILNPIYTPGPGETVAKLVLKSDDPPGPCGPQAGNVVITFNATPAAPTALGTTICAGSTATLSATAPGGAYQWYDAPTAGNLLASGPSFTTLPLAVNTTYYVQTTLNGLTSTRTAVIVTVNATPAAPIAPAVQTCGGTRATLTASGSAGTYAWYDAAIGGNLLSNTNTYTTPSLSFNTSYYVQAQVGSCISPRTQVDVTLAPVPTVTSIISGTACSGNAFSYTITSDVPTATFIWSRAVVAGISNPAVTNQTSSTITEALINTTNNPINVTYVITPMSGTCSGAPFSYVVMVYPLPTITSSATPAAICNQTSPDYAITFNTPGTTFTWGRGVVPGISNAAVSGQTASVIKEVLFNTTNAPVNVTYTINYKTSTCTATPFNVLVTVYPTAVVTSSTTSIACSEQPEGYVITSNIPSATFNWSRPGVGTNPPVVNQTSSTINEVLINNGLTPLTVIYTIIPIANGCNGTSFQDTVSINPTVFKPIANNNSPVCVGSTIKLLTAVVPNAIYSWTGPNGFTSADQNPVINNAKTSDDGVYTLTTTVRGCTSAPGTTTVEVDEPSKAVILSPASPLTVCDLEPNVDLQGEIINGTSTTGQWSTSGNGTFVPAIDALNARYLFTPEDKANKSVVLTLTTTSKSDCAISTASVTIQFGPLPAVDAGPDQSVCSQDALVKLDGKALTNSDVEWVSLGSGHFVPAPNILDGSYAPSAEDVKNGKVQLVLTSLNAGPCFIPTDTMTIKFVPPPTLNAGGTRYVLKGNTITLDPVTSNDTVTYLWSPNIDINDVTAKNPVITGDINRAYILTVTDPRGCQTIDTTFIIVSPPINLTNTITPNGDGINDTWEITGLIAYTDATVDIFNRFGTKLFHSVGYPKAWDGTYNGQPVPAGVYYYIINTKVNNQVLSGSLTVLR